MRALLPALFVLVAALPVRAETIRVAVARGTSLRIEGRALALRVSPDGPGTAIKSPVTFDMVGPFVSSGERLEPALFLSDAEDSLTINGMPLGGAAEVTTDKGSLLAIDIVDLERYVAAVVGSEMPTDWPAAALQAQAIAARTYVLRRKRTEPPATTYDVEATVASQVYRGRASLEAPAVAAARETAGKVLMFGEDLAEAFFFASCVGTTEEAATAFGHAEPYLKPVSCQLGSDVATWTRTIPLEKAAQLFAASGLFRGELTDMSIETKSTTGRVAAAKLEGSMERRTVYGNDLRRALGYQTLPSLDFRVQRKGDSLVFSGHGAGHGVGLCQWCAREMAAHGKVADDILGHFYPGTRIQTATVLAAEP
jgi:stage II sporulation protein D